LSIILFSAIIVEAYIGAKMLKEISINLGNLFLSLSDAVDLASSSIASHQLKTSYIAWRIGKVAKFPEETIEKIFIASLLHDIGALSPEEKIRLHDFEEKNMETHCIIGESLYKLSPLLRPAAKIVRYHHKPWKEWETSIESPNVLGSQIIFLADLLERLIKRDQYILYQVEDLTSKITSISGTEIHPDVVDLFMVISRHEDFWLDLMSPRLYSLLLHLGPFRQFEIDLKTLSSISLLFRSIIDFRSHFTATHSTGVAECAAILSKIFGLTRTEEELMKIAGNFHDLGKLAVPNFILDKPAKLTKEEFAVIKQHTYFTYTVLNTIGGLDQISEWAAFHHEKLNGSGYPFHISADKISTGARIMAVADMFTALAEDRPYRKGMQRKEIEGILITQANKDFMDKRIVSLLLENYDEVFKRVKKAQAVAKEYYERQLANILKQVST
jgi:HD-GYP domain-containing protein (c-di-GMP phosphodiesterase class II)